jgi:tRNA (cmo5U34)-methyltransferase
MSHMRGHFEDPHTAASYAVNARNNVPGLDDLHRMAMLLLAERASEKAQILVVGAGGGMETKAMAEAQADWSFTGVDPSPAMLDAARALLEPFASRVQLLEGTIDQAPLGPFDGATCLLMMHHLTLKERLHTLRETGRRLKQGARLVMVEHSAPGPNPVAWMALSAAFSFRSGFNRERAVARAQTMVDHLTLLTPEEERDLLHQAGFQGVEMFYAAFSFRGWFATVA